MHELSRSALAAAGSGEAGRAEVLGVAAFDQLATPYIAWATPQFIGRYGGDYDHLGRLWEWGVIGGDDEGGPE